MLHHHGDAELGPGLIDLAVNVRPTPAWLLEVLRSSLSDIAAYPSASTAQAAVADRHGVEVDQVLLTSGAAEAFVLLARALQPHRAIVVHPQFTEPEAALRAAGHEVERVILDYPFTLSDAAIPDDADLVMVGNPTNPTAVLHPSLARLARPGRLLVVDEAFLDGGSSLAGHPDVVVIRSLTKAWGLAGLRCGYVIGAPAMIRRLAAAQPLWPVSTPALAAIVACSAQPWPAALDAERDTLVAALDFVRVVPDGRAPFVLLDHGGSDDVRRRLRARGFAARRGDTFPGLGPSWLRVAVRDPLTSATFADALKAAL